MNGLHVSAAITSVVSLNEALLSLQCEKVALCLPSLSSCSPDRIMKLFVCSSLQKAESLSAVANLFPLATIHYKAVKCPELCNLHPISHRPDTHAQMNKMLNWCLWPRGGGDVMIREQQLVWKMKNTKNQLKEYLMLLGPKWTWSRKGKRLNNNTYVLFYSRKFSMQLIHGSRNQLKVTVHLNRIIFVMTKAEHHRVNRCSIYCRATVLK